MEGLTLGTLPEPDIKRKGGKDMSTVRTALGRGIPLVNLDQGASVPLRFVFQLTHEFAPADIADGLGEAMVGEHVLDGQTLDTDHLVLVNDARREFVLIIPSPVSNTGMDASHLEAGFVPVLAPLLFLGQPLLSLDQFLLVCAEELRITHLLPRREQ